MVPMGLGMSAVNAGVLFLENNQTGNLIINPLLSSTDDLMLGVLCDASTLLNEQVLKLLILGMLALLLSGIGGIVGGYIVYLFKRGNN